MKHIRTIKFIALALFASLVLGLLACSKISLSKIQNNDFAKAASTIGLGEDELLLYREPHQFRFSLFEEASFAQQYVRENLYLARIVFDDEEDAFESFSNCVDAVIDELSPSSTSTPGILSDLEFIGNMGCAGITDASIEKTINKDEEVGYIIFSVPNAYGGYYYTEDTIIVIYATNPTSNDISDIQAFLSEFRYPYMPTK